MDLAELNRTIDTELRSNASSDRNSMKKSEKRKMALKKLKTNINTNCNQHSKRWKSSKRCHSEGMNWLNNNIDMNSQNMQIGLQLNQNMNSWNRSVSLPRI